MASEVAVKETDKSSIIPGFGSLASFELSQRVASILEHIQKKVESVNDNLSQLENDQLLQIKTGFSNTNVAFQKQHKAFNDAIYQPLKDLQTQFENAKTDEDRQKVTNEYKSINDMWFKKVTSRIEAINSWAQDRSNLVNSEAGSTSGMKQERQEDIDRIKAKETSDAYRNYADKLQSIGSVERKLATGAQIDPDLWSIQLRNLEAYYNKLAELPTLIR